MVTRQAVRLHPDARRVVTVPFVPGEEMPGGDSRAVAVTERILAMDQAAVTGTLAELKRRFAHRHRDLEATWKSHFALAAHHFEKGADVPAETALLIGAYFTREVSVEAAGLVQPLPLLLTPTRPGWPRGARFVMSLRAPGEGHVSSIEFRTGTIDAAGNSSTTRAPTWGPAWSRPGLTNGAFSIPNWPNTGVTTMLPPSSWTASTHTSGPPSSKPPSPASTPSSCPELLSGTPWSGIRWVAANNYTVEFPARTTISERVLWPNGPSELNGMEDARFVRFVDDDGAVTYRGTYTAFDGSLVAPQMLSTTDFRTFVVSQLSGPFATNKGLALFPRKVGGRHLALSRWDRERLAVTVSDDGREWAEGTTLELPVQPWDLVQVGNCGSPLETAEGWLVLTHGVGPMRSYAIGAVLLDLDKPSQVTGVLPGPFLVPSEDEREGYVPNVVYSCGALLHGGSLVMPYGFSDSGVGFALVDVAELLSRMVSI